MSRNGLSRLKCVKYGDSFVEKLQVKIFNFPNVKHGVSNLSDTAFKGTVVNLALPSLYGESLKILLTVYNLSWCLKRTVNV